MIAKGKVKGIDVVCGSQNFKFMGGSVGISSGEAFIHGVQHAIDNNCSFVFFTSTGGQKMQEGVLSLMQMPRTVIAVNELKKNKIPYIVVLTNPTTGGVTASFAMLGDIHIAEPKATVGFARRTCDSRYYKTNFAIWISNLGICAGAWGDRFSRAKKRFARFSGNIIIYFIKEKGI